MGRTEIQTEHMHPFPTQVASRRISSIVTCEGAPDSVLMSINYLVETTMAVFLNPDS